MPKVTIVGVLEDYYEQGIEGYLVLQDRNFILPPTEDWPYQRFIIAGQHKLATGDRLRIFDKNNPEIILWEGIIEIKDNEPEFPGRRPGMFIPEKRWARWFQENYPAELIKDNPA